MMFAWRTRPAAPGSSAASAARWHAAPAESTEVKLLRERRLLVEYGEVIPAFGQVVRGRTRIAPIEALLARDRAASAIIGPRLEKLCPGLPSPAARLIQH
jgi:hypothetical protein